MPQTASAHGRLRVRGAGHRHLLLQRGPGAGQLCDEFTDGTIQFCVSPSGPVMTDMNSLGGFTAGTVLAKRTGVAAGLDHGTGWRNARRAAACAAGGSQTAEGGGGAEHEPQYSRTVERVGTCPGRHSSRTCSGCSVGHSRAPAMLAPSADFRFQIHLHAKHTERRMEGLCPSRRLVRSAGATQQTKPTE